ncbi:uncharacterized protein LOC129407728 [Boleophthalmus pectinirostris]|uniref:uncharacterized protein LOC129407728 n=1 Tax=Boleophthalmus pectinirostris TaxID=150288 RepID=UPI00242E3BA6|nr:uncharacterized protein LOC129407728 [Boleophthalmus pectinirostris]
MYTCFLGYRTSDPSNLCVVTENVDVKYTGSAVVTGPCRYELRDLTGATQFSFFFEDSKVTVFSSVPLRTLLHLEGRHFVMLTTTLEVGYSYPFLLLGCTSDSLDFVMADLDGCDGSAIATCSQTETIELNYALYIMKYCDWRCDKAVCVTPPKLCSVMMSGVIDKLQVRHMIKDRCAYTLLLKDQVSLAAVFRDQRRRDVPLLDHLELSVGPSNFRLGPGAALQVNGAVVNIGEVPLPEGVSVSRGSSGVLLLVPNVFELIFDGFSAVIKLLDETVSGLCSGALLVHEAKSTTLSEEGCDMFFQDEPDPTVDCENATHQCNHLNDLYGFCNLDVSSFYVACIDTLCRYPLVDGLDCAAHQAYATACSFVDNTPPDWRSFVPCGSEVGVCLDTSCSEHEFCGIQTNKETCLCRSLFTSNHTLGEPAVCSHNSASLTFAACLLAERGVDYELLHLNDPSCTGQLDQNHMITFSFDLANTCGAEITSENEQLWFKNKVTFQNQTSVITRENQFELDFSCFYNQPQIRTVALKIKDSSVVLSVFGLWSYNLTMRVYLDQNRTIPVTPETELPLDLPVWVQLSADGLNPDQVSLMTDACWATNQPTPDSTPRYDLVLNGCPNPSDLTVKVFENGFGVLNFFVFNTFEFTGLDSKVFLHCQVSLCVLQLHNCVPVCGGARRRRSTFKDPNPGLISMTWTE